LKNTCEAFWKKTATSSSSKSH